MTTEEIVFGLSLISLIISGLAIIIGIISLSQVKKNYPNSPINWSKNFFLFVIWGLIFIFNYGLLKHNNWAKNGLIFLLGMLFILLSVVIIFNFLSYILLLLKKYSLLDNQTAKIAINQEETLPENDNLDYPEDLNEINYNTSIFEEEKDLDELNIYEDEGNNDEIYYLDNQTEENELFPDKSSDFFWESSLESYTKQGLLITIIMAFFANVIIFYWISFLENIPSK